MIADALFSPISILMMVLVALMSAVSLLWLRHGEARLSEVRGGLSALRALSGSLGTRHPLRLRLEAAPVAEVSLEEVAHLLHGSRPGPAARALLLLEARLGWVERFAQFAVHLGILGTVLGLALSDPTDLAGFRARLPLALGTTFWGLVGALTLSALGGAVEGVLTSARRELRMGLLSSFDEGDADAPAPTDGDEKPSDRSKNA